uniref:Uncharacterized protein n=1 Tax=Anguilla anguilla TaxID=7936 RepID=A0A0E9PDH3_ANGAN
MVQGKKVMATILLYKEKKYRDTASSTALSSQLPILFPARKKILSLSGLNLKSLDNTAWK